MTHAIYARSTLTNKYKSELISICETRGLDSTGLKNILVNRIIEAQPKKVAKSAPAPMILAGGVEVIDYNESRQRPVADGVVRWGVSQHGKFVGSIWTSNERYFCYPSSNEGEATLLEAVELLCPTPVEIETDWEEIIKVDTHLDRQIKFSPAKVEVTRQHLQAVHHRMEETRGVAENLPQDLIEELTLNLLDLTIVDREIDCPHTIPHGDIRYWVHQGASLIGAVSTWGERFTTPNGKYNGWATLFEAVTSFLSRNEVAHAASNAEAQLRERFATAIDYM